MAHKSRYYCECQPDGRIDHVIAQDDTGVWHGGTCIDEHGKAEVRVGLIRAPGPDVVFLRGWTQPREVQTTDPVYLEFVRTMERSSYLPLRPTAIEERPEPAREAARAVLDRALAAGNVVIHDFSAWNEGSDEEGKVVPLRLRSR